MPRFFRNWLNLVRVGQALKNKTNWLIWLGVPIALFVSTIILRFGVFPQFPRWHFYLNIAISLVLILYVSLYTRTSKGSKKLLGLGLLFQVPIIAFNFMEILDITDEIIPIMNDIIDDLFKARGGNQRAAQRARVAMIKYEKLAKALRKASVIRKVRETRNKPE